MHIIHSGCNDSHGRIYYQYGQTKSQPAVHLKYSVSTTVNSQATIHFFDVYIYWSRVKLVKTCMGPSPKTPAVAGRLSQQL